MCNFGNFGYSNMNFGFSDGFSYGGSYGYNSFGGNPFGGFNAGPSRVNMNFSNGSMFMGPSLYTRGGCGGFFGGSSARPYYGGMMMPVRYNQTVDRIYAGADGLTKILSGVDDLSYALQARQYS